MLLGLMIVLSGFILGDELSARSNCILPNPLLISISSMFCVICFNKIWVIVTSKTTKLKTYIILSLFCSWQWT
jgi:hypothetical protein